MLKVDDFNNYTLGVPVISQVKGDYDVLPASLFFGRVTANTSETRECLITPFQHGDSLELVSSTADMSSNPLVIEIDRESDGAVVRGTFTAQLGKGVFERTLKFKLTPRDGSEPQYLQVPAIALHTRPRSKSTSIGMKQDH
jgi:hypothetical protein